MTHIRPTMLARHRGFSASWAPDYRPIYGLFHGRMPASAEATDAAELRREIKLCHSIHAGVAAKLVVDGRSLLQQSGFVSRDTVDERRLLSAIYDDYFMTLRASISTAEVTAQLLRRLFAIVQDVTVNGLRVSEPPSHDGEVEELRSTSVMAVEAEFARTMLRVATSAAGVTDEPLGARHEQPDGTAHCESDQWSDTRS